MEGAVPAGTAAEDLGEGLRRGADGLVRCWWPGTDPLYLAYHDEEWGRPVTDERTMFEILVLEAFQAGLSWLTILRRREGFRAAFDGFDPERIAAYGDADVARLLADAGIIRNRVKILATIGNAQAVLRFLGPTVVYAHMQAAGVVNDHILGCAFRDPV